MGRFLYRVSMALTLLAYIVVILLMEML